MWVLERILYGERIVWDKGGRGLVLNRGMEGVREGL